MDAPELLAVSMGLSIVVAGLGWIGGRSVERSSADPRLRDRMWGAVLALPVLPPLAVGLLLLTPPPVQEIVLAPAAAPSTDAAALVVTAVEASGPVLTLDPSMAAWAAIAVAGSLALFRLGALMLRTRRLNRLIRNARAPDAALAEMVADAAHGLAVRAPHVSVTESTHEALLAGPGRARLVLPTALTAGDPAVRRAVIIHELAHLKRGDHRALWLEEALLALLAFNPVMPALRARRAAAREEACDALALNGAAPETRRAYARSLIEALRSRAAPQGLPALTFTGAGRTTAMSRLKAVLNPAPAAGRRSRLVAAAAAAAILAAAGAASWAVAGEREAIVRIGAPALFTADADAEPRPAPLQSPAVRPAASPAAEAAVREAASEAFSRLTPDQQTRYRNPTAREYQALCASDDPGDGGFCAGVMFSQLGGGICPSPSVDQGNEAARRAALGALVERGKAEIARSTVRPGDTPGSLARAALSRAYPCDAAALRTVEPAAPGGVMARPLDYDDAAALGEAGGVVGESVLLTLDIDLAPGVSTTPGGTLTVNIQPMNDRPRTRLQIPVGGTFDPIPMGVAVKGAAATPEDYAITADIRDSDGRVLFATSAPVQITAANRPVRTAVLLAPAT